MGGEGGRGQVGGRQGGGGGGGRQGVGRGWGNRQKFLKSLDEVALPYATPQGYWEKNRLQQ